MSNQKYNIILELKKHIRYNIDTYNLVLGTYLIIIVLVLKSISQMQDAKSIKIFFPTICLVIRYTI